MAYKYSFQEFDATSMARASTVNAKISMKKSVELARALVGKKVHVAQAFLENVMAQKQVVEYRRYNTEMPHRKGKGVMAGGYPVNVAEVFLKVLLNAKKNAENLNLGEELKVKSASSRKGASRYKMSRLSGRKMKATHVEIILAQATTKKSKGNKRSDSEEVNEK